MKYIKIFIITLFIMFNIIGFQAKAGDPLFKVTKVVSGVEQAQQTVSKADQLMQRIEQLKATVMEYVEKGKSLIDKGKNLFTEDGFKNLLSEISGAVKNGKGKDATSSANKEEAAYEEAIEQNDQEKLGETIFNTFTYSNMLDAEANIQYINEYMQHYAASLYTDAILTRYMLAGKIDKQEEDSATTDVSATAPTGDEFSAKMQIDKANYEITSDIAKRLSRIVVMQARLNHAEQMNLLKGLSQVEENASDQKEQE